MRLRYLYFKMQLTRNPNGDNMTCDRIIELAIQIISATATAVAVIIALRDSRRARKVHNDDVRRRQAEGVSCWLEDLGSDDHVRDSSFLYMRAALLNRSESPVYNVVITCVGIQGNGPEPSGELAGPDYDCRSYVSVLPPGSWSALLPTYGRGMGIVLGSEIAFTDARGASWIRRANGRLEAIDASPINFYGISLPIPWMNCDRMSR